MTTNWTKTKKEFLVKKRYHYENRKKSFEIDKSRKFAWSRPATEKPTPGTLSVVFKSCLANNLREK